MIVNEDMIPITLFMGLTVVLCLYLWFRFRTRSEMQTTIRTAIDKGQELSPPTYLNIPPDILSQRLIVSAAKPLGLQAVKP